MATLAYIDGVRDVMTTSGTPGVTTQDFTVSGVTDTPKAALVIVVRATADDTLTSQFCQSIGIADGSFEGGIATSFASGSLALSTPYKCGFDDAVIRLPNTSANGFDAVGSFDSFISGGVRIVWDTIPTAAYQVHVVLFFGGNLQASAGTVVPPSSGTSQVTTGFVPSHIITLCNGGTSLDESFYSNMDIQVGHTIRTSGTSVKTRTLANQFVQAVSSSGTVLLSDADVGLVFTGGTTPVTPSVTTQIDSVHPSDGFLVKSAGTGTGPRVIYLALDYGTSQVELENFETPTSTGSVNYSSGFKVSAALSLNSIFNSTTWSGDSVTANSGFMSYGLLSANAEWCAGNRARDNVSPTVTDSYTDSRIVSTWQATSTPSRVNRGDGSFHSSDGVDINWSDVQTSGRQIALLFLGEDIFQASGAGSFALAEADGTALLAFQATGAGNFPLAQAAGTGSLTFQASGAGSFALAEADGTGTTTDQGFAATGAGTFVLPTANGLLILAFRATGAGAFPLATAAGTGYSPTGPGLGCESLVLGDYDKTSTMSGNYSVAKAMTGDYKTITDLEGDNC